MFQAGRSRRNYCGLRRAARWSRHVVPSSQRTVADISSSFSTTQSWYVLPNLPSAPSPIVIGFLVVKT
eukprot:4668385-Pyramimonas_sp.AAC.1